jgi:hypothetical protein
MGSVSDLTIDSFLPRARMKAVGKSAHVSYVDAKPFPHMMILGKTDFTYHGHRNRSGAAAHPASTQLSA